MLLFYYLQWFHNSGEVGVDVDSDKDVYPSM